MKKAGMVLLTIVCFVLFNNCAEVPAEYQIIVQKDQINALENSTVVPVEEIVTTVWNEETKQQLEQAIQDSVKDDPLAQGSLKDFCGIYGGYVAFTLNDDNIYALKTVQLAKIAGMNFKHTLSADAVLLWKPGTKFTTYSDNQGTVKAEAAFIPPAIAYFMGLITEKDIHELAVADPRLYCCWPGKDGYECKDCSDHWASWARIGGFRPGALFCWYVYNPPLK